MGAFQVLRLVEDTHDGMAKTVIVFHQPDADRSRKSGLGAHRHGSVGSRLISKSSPRNKCFALSRGLFGNSNTVIHRLARHAFTGLQFKFMAALERRVRAPGLQAPYWILR